MVLSFKRKNSLTTGVKSSGGAVLLCLDFLTVLEGEADVVSAVDGGVFYETVPAVNMLFVFLGMLVASTL